MVVATAQHHFADVTDDDLLRKCQRTVEHNALGAEPIDALQREQKIDGLRHVDDAPDAVHLEGLVARLQALVDLLQTQKTCGTSGEREENW